MKKLFALLPVFASLFLSAQFRKDVRPTDQPEPQMILLESSCCCLHVYEFEGSNGNGAISWDNEETMYIQPTTKNGQDITGILNRMNLCSGGVVTISSMVSPDHFITFKINGGYVGGSLWVYDVDMIAKEEFFETDEELCVTFDFNCEVDIAAFIPLGGTEEDFPVTGFIEIEQETGTGYLGSSGSGVGLFSEDDTVYSGLIVEPNKIVTYATPTFEGIQYDQDYSANFDSLSIPHIQYVKEMIAKHDTVKVYRALVSQTGTGNPTAIVLENSLGNITWTRSSTGIYEINGTDLFTVNKTALTFSNVLQEIQGKIHANPLNFTDDQLILQTQSENTDSDDELWLTPVFIYVYP